AERVDVGGVEEVDPGVDRATDQLVGLALPLLADDFPVAGAAERHRAEAQLRDVKPRVSEHAVFHVSRRSTGRRGEPGVLARIRSSCILYTIMAEYTFFFTEKSPFSQWYRCRFVVGGNTFICAEQYMMHGKAVLFGDAEIAAKILAADHPRSHKALGRKVKGFDDAVWKREREAIVMAGSRAKFTQNADLRELLPGTRGTTLVEASPHARIWGIGLAATDPRAHDASTWRGQNLLGKILTALREELLAAPAAITQGPSSKD